MSNTKPTGLDLLRVPFEPKQISKLPKPTKKREEMDKLPKGKCNVCGGYHATSNVIHLDYVGHAALTDRLLDADPYWNWEPLALTAEGLPVIDRDGGMWIKLTVCGITRLGYGDAQGKAGGDAMKERIGDALRNAAMRFGAALDLWHKGDLHADDDKPEPSEPVKVSEPAKPKPDYNFRKACDEQKKRLGDELYYALIVPYKSSIEAEGLPYEDKKKIVDRLKAAKVIPADNPFPEESGLLDRPEFDLDK